eukprot:2727458-Amphidinium_carterae.1
MDELFASPHFGTIGLCIAPVWPEGGRPRFGVRGVASSCVQDQDVQPELRSPKPIKTPETPNNEKWEKSGEK